jgi:hypothetical protein
MREMKQNSEAYVSSPELYHILATSISIFDSAITLLGEPSTGRAELPGPAQVACMRHILHCLGIGEDAPDFF